MDSNNSISLPLPPRAVKAPNEVPSKIEDAIVTLNNGSSLTGRLIRYVESEKSISILPNDEGEQENFNLNQIKSFQLVNSRHFALDEKYLGLDRNDITLPSERQEFQIIYTDESSESGETLGHVTDDNGIHLFIAQAFYNYYHMFVPFSAIKEHQIGQALGKTLVKNKVVTQEEVDQGLNIQEEIRNKKLGEYLTSEAIVSPEELETAIKKQESSPNIRLGEALIQDELITDIELEKALSEQKQNREIPLGEILINMGAVSKDEMKKTLASKLGIPFVNLKQFTIDLTVIKMVPEKICRRHNIMPLCLYESKLIVAVENPLNRLPLEDLRFHTKTFVEPVMASIDEIDWAIEKYYGTEIDEIADALDIDDDEEDSQDFIGESDNALVKLVNKMIMDAHAQGASDIHIEPYPGKKKTIVRFRKDGELLPYVELPPSYRNALISRLKIMCNLDISERRKPQDGKIDFKKFGPLRIELRVATIPTSGGLEDVVLRVLANGEPIPLDQMGIRTEYLSKVEDLVSKPYGLFLVCGPTGSGKTTTLHSILGYINTPDKKIWTAEDPVEITQVGLRQLQVNPKIDLTFANAMRAFLRADPDVIMVGEMRDPETTATGIEASLTGHMVLSTLHTNSAPESIVRLLDMGMDPYNFADALLGILAQRLTKRLCPICKKSHNASDQEVNDLLEEYGLEIYKDFSEKEKEMCKKHTLKSWKEKFGIDGVLQLHEAVGCDECGNTGYDGRLALHELLVSSNEIKKLIHESATVAVLTKQAFEEGMVTLKQDGIEKILQGHTDIHQVRSVCIK